MIGLDELQANSNRFIYVTKRNLGEAGSTMVPTKGDLLDETAGCIVSLEAAHGFLFSSAAGNKLLSDVHEAKLVYKKYVEDPANARITLVKRDPDSGNEYILAAESTTESPRTPLRVVYVWIVLLVASVALAFAAYKYSGTPYTPTEYASLARRRRRLYF